MERCLKCNDFRCSAELKDEAFVTSCSHNYCRDCAVRLGLASEDPSQRVCPACNTQLPNHYDVLCNTLNPPEEWKTNILGGMSPSIIMECAGKALSFWGYQMVMEMSYLEGLNRRLTIDRDLMASKHEKQINEYKTTMDRQASDIEARTNELEECRQTNATMASKLREASQKAAQFQRLHETMKRNATLEQIQQTASQLISPNIDAAPGKKAPLVEQHLGQQYTYLMGTTVSPRYADAQPTRQRSLDASFSPRLDSARYGATNPLCGNANSGVQPRLDGRNPPRAEVHETPRSKERPRVSGTTGMGLSSVHGVVAGTPLGIHGGTPRVRTDPIRRIVDPRQPQKAPVPFPGVGVGPGLGSSRHRTNGTRSGSFNNFSAHFEGSQIAEHHPFPGS